MSVRIKEFIPWTTVGGYNKIQQLKDIYKNNKKIKERGHDVDG